MAVFDPWSSDKHFSPGLFHRFAGLSGMGPAGRTPRSIKGLVLSVGHNGRYFINQQGEPFFYLGDTVWTLLKRLNRSEVDEYLKNRLAKGFTVIQTYLLRGLKVPNLYGDLTLINSDPGRPNEGFFQNVDYVVSRANELGLVMGIVVTWGEHVRQVRTDDQVFSASNASVFGNYLGNRYGNNAVIWLLGGDRKPFEDKEVWGAMAKGLKAGSRGAHLVSYHGPGDRATPSSSFWFHNEDWLDFNTIQSGHGWAIPNYNFVTHDYNLKPAKPTLDMEARYENHPDVRTSTGRRMDAHQAREAAYWAVLAGAAGHGYGCNDMWQLYDEERELPVDDYSYPLDTLMGNTNWHKAMDFEGAYGVGLMRSLVELRPWYMMVPDQSVIAAGQGEGEDHIQAARALDGSFILAYLTFGNPVNVHMDRLSGTRIKAQWYDPRNGEWENAGQHSNAGVREFMPPSSGEQDDWVLVLEDADKNYPTPS